MWYIPDIQVVTLASAEPLVLNQKDDCERHRPVSEQGYEIADDCRQVLTTSDSKNGDDNGVDQRPEETGNGVEVMPQKLHAEAGRVVYCDVVSDNGEDEEDKAEFGKAERMEGLSQETAESVVVIRVCENWVY